MKEMREAIGLSLHLSSLISYHTRFISVGSTNHNKYFLENFTVSYDFCAIV